MSSRRRRSITRVLPLLLTLAVSLPVAHVAAQDLLEQTQPLRAALHKDPTLEAPLERLVEAWRSAGRIQELLGVYGEHLATYPEDRNAAVVLIRLELAAGDPAAMPATAAAVAAYPEDAYVWYLRSRSLAVARDGGALDALEKAVTFETAAWRKRTWAERLVDEALKAGRPELARRHLAAAAGGDDSPAGRLATARRQAQANQPEEALASLSGIVDAEPELAVEIEVVAAEQEATLKRNAAAAKRLDAVLVRLAADHWRRPEVLRRRIDLAAEGAEREALLAAAKARVAAAPGDDAAVIDQARLLTATDRRQEALAALVSAYAHAPTPRLEIEVLAAFDRVHDLAALDAWLATQITADPARGDLVFRRVRVLLEREQRDQAWALLDATLPGLPEGEGDDRLLAVGRDLARANRGAEAQQVLTRLHARRPARLDVTRELADACLAAGRRDQAEALFAANAQGRSLPAGVAAEQVLETVNFLQGKKLLVTASRLAEERLASDPGDFELRLASIRLLARLGDGVGAEQRVTETRVLADTAVRYRRWLEVVVESISLERRPDLLVAERALLDREAGEWTAVQAARRAAFAEACIGADNRALASAVLRADVLVAPEGERAPLLRALAKLLTGPEDVPELRATLTALAEEDPLGAPDALARRALIDVAITNPNTYGNQYGNPFTNLEPQAIPEELAAIDPRQLSDPQVLERCWSIYADGNATDKAVWCAERLVQLEPANASRWERWCLSLAATGDEEALRAALRRLLAGVENLPLKPVVRDQLQDAVLDSTWRSCARLAAGSQWKELLAVANEAEPLAQTVQQGRWLAWSRCLALARLGRVKLPDAIAELTRRCAGDPVIVFPDGLSTTLTSALAQCTVAPAQRAPAVARRGPLPPWRAAWAHTSTASIVGIFGAGEALVICDAGGSVSVLDPLSGRLRWTASGVVEPPKQIVNEWGGFDGAMTAARLPVVVSAGPGAGDVLVAVVGADVVAYAAVDGAVRWRSTLIAAPAGVATAAGVVVVWNNKTGDCVGLDPLTGRVRWVLELPLLAEPARAPSPASASDGTLVVILGMHGGIVDAASGQVLWSASIQDVEAPIPAFNGPQTVAAAAPPLVRNWRQRRRLHQPSTVAVPAVSYMTNWGGQYPTSYFNPAQAPTTTLVGGLLGIALSGNGPTPDLYAGQLLLSSPNALGWVDVSLPLAITMQPPGTPVGAWGQRLIVLQPDGATVRHLATGTERNLDLAPLRRSAATVAESLQAGHFQPGHFQPGQPAGQAPEPDAELIAGLAMPVATMDGRLVWLAGPAGVAAYDVETGEAVAMGAWPTTLELDPLAVTDDQRIHGVILGERLITPAGGRVIVALERNRDGQ